MKVWSQAPWPFFEWNKKSNNETETSLKLQHLQLQIGHVWYINILTWLQGFQNKLLCLLVFSLYPSLLWDLKNKEKIESLTQKPLVNVRMLIYQMQPFGYVLCTPMKRCPSMLYKTTMTLNEFWLNLLWSCRTTSLAIPKNKNPPLPSKFCEETRTVD